MAKRHQDAKDFLLGAFIGGILGIAAINLTRPGHKKNSSTQHLIGSLSHFGKTIASSKSESNLAAIIDWTAEGIQLWNKLKKRS
jgi:gas vesicle protein